VVSVKDSVVAEIPDTPGGWGSLNIFDMEPGDISRLEIQGAGRQPFRIHREENGQWSSSSGSVDPVKAESLVNTLAKLRAIRRVWGEEAAAFGEPAVTVRFNDHTLIIGQNNPDSQWLAQ